MYTVGAVAKKSGLSRTALLYYHRIGLLVPSATSAAGYRLYSEHDLARLEKIILYREAGLPLAEIGRILKNPGLNDEAVAVLERRLAVINDEISRSRRQQRLILRLIGHDAPVGKARAMGKQDWTRLLRAAGLGDADMERWHVEFERLAPEAHQDFLEALGMPEAEIVSLRRRAGAAADDGGGEGAGEGTAGT